MACRASLCCGGELPARSPIPRTASLDGQGEGAPLIGYPDLSGVGAQLADRIARKLDVRFGVQAVVRPADEIRKADYHQRTVILLGHIVNNPEILWFYSFRYAFVDAAYPGGDGYVIRQVHDPVGAGRNTIVIGAGSEAGLVKGVDRFASELHRLERPEWTTRLIVESTLDVVSRPPDDLDPAGIEAAKRESLASMRSGRLSQEAYKAIHAAHAYYLSGSEAYLRRYDALVRAHRDFTASGDDQFYGGLEFWLPAYIQAWDIAEEAAIWTDGDRTRMASFVMDLMALLSTRYGRYADIAEAKPRPRWNHETFPAMAYFYMAEYLRKYYGNAWPAEQWRSLSRRILGDQTRFIRGTDESCLYLPYSPSHALRFAIATRSHDMIASGRARQFGEQLLMMTDNTGRFVGTGATERKNIAYYYLLPLGTILGDGRFLGIDQKTRLAVERPTEPRDDWGVMSRFGEYRPPLAPSMPDCDTHVWSLPVDEGLFELTNTVPFYEFVPIVRSAVPRERVFDKLVFRSGYEQGRQYLLLDGFGRGKHLRYDTNAIVRFTSGDRIFLVETDNDQRIDEKYHNMLTCIRDGRGGLHVPPFAELEAAVDLAETGFSRSHVSDYADVNWTRNILWIKESLFAVIDEVEALGDGDFSLRCHWHGLGDVSISDKRVLLQQSGQTCAIMHSGSLSVRAEADTTEGRSLWGDYPHAAPVIQRICQTRTLAMKRGDRSAFHNVICAFPSTRPRVLSCASGAPGHLLLAERGSVALFFVDADVVPNPFVTDARMGLINQDRIALVRATTIKTAGLELLRSTRPVDVEFDVVEGTATFSHGSVGEVRLIGSGTPLRLGGRKQSVQWTPPVGLSDRLRESLVASQHSLQVAQPTETSPISRLPRMEVVQTGIERNIHAFLAPPGDGTEGDTVVLGTDSACEAIRFDSKGKGRVLWRASSDAAVTALAWASLLQTDTPAVVFGSEDGTIVAADVRGKVLWQHQLKAPKRLQRQITSLTAGDVDGDGRGEIVAGSASWNVYCLDGNGRELWTQPAYAHRVTCLATGDITGNGGAEVLVGTSYYTLSAFDAEGRVLLGHRANPLFGKVIVAELDDDGRKEIIAANGSDVLALDIAREKIEPRAYTKGMSMPRLTSERFRFRTGDDVGDLSVCDLDGDGKPEIVAVSDTGFIYCFDGSGRLRATFNAGDAACALTTGPSLNGESMVAAGSRDGHVLVLDKALKPLGRAKLRHPAQWLTIGGDRMSVICVTRRSVEKIVIR